MAITILDMDTRRKFRGIIKAAITVLEERKGKVDIDDIVELLIKASKMNGAKYLKDLIEYAHIGRYDSIMWEELIELIRESRNPYVRYDKNIYVTTIKIFKEVFSQEE